VPAFGYLNVVGSIVTGSHGVASLASLVNEIEIVNVDSKVERFDVSQGKDFLSMLNMFGVLGIVTKVKLKVVESYSLNVSIDKDRPWSEIEFLSACTDFSKP
jgi:FAD/FMN-containing dehydrogenase